MTDARNHHYVPQGYLRRFSKGVGRKSQVQVIDLQEGITFRSATRNVASERDFNRISAEGHDPGALERAYGEFEGMVSPAIARVIERASFTGDDRTLILNLMALLAVRHPGKRAIYADFLARIYKQTLSLMTSTEERWDGVVRNARAAGYIKADAPTDFLSMRRMMDEDAYTLSVSQHELIHAEIETFDAVLQSLGNRKWHLYLAKAGEGDIVTSDHPVCLGSTAPRKGSYGLGYGLRDTYVMFPLSTSACLWGTFELGEDATVEISAAPIAEINVRVIDKARRQVYASDLDFFYRADGDLIGGERLASDSRFRKRPSELNTPVHI